MKIKTFYARTMAEALVEIKSSLGPDALILSSKPIARRSALGGAGIQVVAATDNHQAHLTSGAGDVADLTAGAAEKRNETARLDTYIPALPPAGHASSRTEEIPCGFEAPKTGSPDRANIPLQLYRDLLANDFSESLAHRLVDQSCRALAGSGRINRKGLLSAIGEAAQKMLSPALRNDGFPMNQFVVFLGPAGVGKTTATAKLAAQLSVMRDKKVALFTLDTYRIGAIEQMRAYATLMGLPFRAISDVSDLRRAVSDHSRRDFILIDTPGQFQQDAAPVAEMMEYLQATGNTERHLVLSATTKAGDLTKMADWYRPYDALIFTKLDETTTLGPILNELIRTQKPLSYYCDGQSIPDDLHTATPDEFVEAALNAITNGARTWNESASPNFISTQAKPKSRQVRKPAPKRSTLPMPPRRRKAQEQELSR